MTKIHKHTEALFEKISTKATFLLGNSITFMFALGLVIFWFSNAEFYTQSIHKMIGDIIFSITFLSLFIIQKSFNKFSGSLHLKVNELVSSHESANNAVINIETKTELEINELSKEYTELAEQLHELEEGKGV
jgi:low affinity Fe/Cu permease